MQQTIGKVEVTGIPPYVESWSVARIPGFVSAVLNRWQREYGRLPASFAMVMCPQVEVDAQGGLPPKVYELTDARLRCQHFTGCNKPYRVIIFTGEDAEERRAQVQRLLSWSEGYTVESSPDVVSLRFAEAMEEIEHEPPSPPNPRRLQELLKTGELLKILE